MLNRILELIRTPPQDIIGLSESIRQLQTLRPTSKPTSEVVRETKQKMATQSDSVVQNRKLPNRSFLYLTLHISWDARGSLAQLTRREKLTHLGENFNLSYILKDSGWFLSKKYKFYFKSERILMHHVFVLLILKQCQAPWGAKKNFIEKTFKINVTNRFSAIKTNLVEKSVKNQTSLMCTVAYFPTLNHLPTRTRNKMLMHIFDMFMHSTIELGKNS